MPSECEAEESHGGALACCVHTLTALLSEDTDAAAVLKAAERLDFKQHLFRPLSNQQPRFQRPPPPLPHPPALYAPRSPLSAPTPPPALRGGARPGGRKEGEGGRKKAGGRER
eukprot:2091634-Rhodomonas_salina.2